MVLLVYAAICGIVNMEVIPDSLLFAKVRHIYISVCAINNAHNMVMHFFRYSIRASAPASTIRVIIMTDRPIDRPISDYLV